MTAAWDWDAGGTVESFRQWLILTMPTPRQPRTALGSGVVPLPPWTMPPHYGVQVVAPAKPTIAINGDVFEVEEVSFGGTWRIVAGLRAEAAGGAS